MTFEAMVEPKIKGFAVIKARDTLEAQLGEGWLTQTAREQDPAWPERLLPGEWYPLSTHYYAMERAHAALGTSPSLRAMVTELARDTAIEDLNGLLRAFLWVATPRMFLRTATRIWDTYANFTTVSEIDNAEDCYTVHIVEIPAEFVDWVAGCWLGFLPAALELVGAEEVKGEILDAKPSEGADTWELRFRMTYTS